MQDRNRIRENETKGVLKSTGFEEKETEVIRPESKSVSCRYKCPESRREVETCAERNREKWYL